MFLTPAELNPYLRCHRNVAGLEFLNKTNNGLLCYLTAVYRKNFVSPIILHAVSVNGISDFIR